MQKYLIFIQSFLILIFFTNCNQEKSKVNNEFVNDKEYISILNEVLSDTLNSNIIESKKIILANCDISYSPIFHLGDTSEYDFLCEVLNEEDTLFIKNQYKDSICFDISDLKQFGFEIYDLKSKIKIIDFDSIRNEIKSINIKNKKPEYENYFRMMKRPIVNKKRDKIFIRINGLTSGETLLATRKDSIWEVEKIGRWMQ